MKKLNEYSQTTTGVLAYALDAHEALRRMPLDCPQDTYDTGYHVGQMKAYSEIVRLITGKPVPNKRRNEHGTF